MNELREIRDILRRMAANDSGVLVLTVQIKSVGDWSCTATYGDLELSAIRLFSHPTKYGNLRLKPKVGSMATVIASPDLRDLQLIEADEIESIRFEENGLVVEYDSVTKKIDIKNGAVSLKDLFQSVADLVKNLKVAGVTSGSSLATVDPTTQASVLKFETSFKQLLK